MEGVVAMAIGTGIVVRVLPRQRGKGTQMKVGWRGEAHEEEEEQEEEGEGDEVDCWLAAVVLVLLALLLLLGLDLLLCFLWAGRNGTEPIWELWDPTHW